MTFTSQNGNITCAYTNYTEEKAEAEKAQKVDEFTFTEKGNLIYHIESNPDKSGFRVLPLSEESRTYYKKYVVPANTFAAGPLDASWNNEDFSGLNWEWIFERLWEIKTGRDMLDPASKYYKKAPDNNHFDSVCSPRGDCGGNAAKILQCVHRGLAPNGAVCRQNRGLYLLGL